MSLVDSQNLRAPLLIACTAVIAAVFVRRCFAHIAQMYRFRIQDGADSIPHFVGLPFLGCLDWNTRRNEWIRECLTIIPGNAFRLKTPAKLTVTVLRGQNSASVFFNHKNLDVSRGYMALMSKNVKLQDVKGMPFTDSGLGPSLFHSRLKTLLNPELLDSRTYSVIRNIEAAHHEISVQGTQDLFGTYYFLVLRLLMRVVLPDTITDDDNIVGYLHQLYRVIDLPGTKWMPFYKRWAKYYYGFKLYRALGRILKEHQEGDEGGNWNTVDILLDKGDGIEGIISFTIGAMYAGLVNAARLIPWIVIHLTVYPEWKTRTLEEMRELLDRYNATPESLDRIPFRAWETDLPQLDMVADEILRTLADGVLLRQNIGEAINIDQCTTIPAGGFVAYPLSDAHHNPEHYGAASRTFKPGHIESMPEGKNTVFLGWGCGRHPCLGKSVAQMLYRLVLTHLLMHYDLEVFDKLGKPIKSLPAAELNSLALPAPVNMPVRMTAKPKAEKYNGEH